MDLINLLLPVLFWFFSGAAAKDDERLPNRCEGGTKLTGVFYIKEFLKFLKVLKMVFFFFFLSRPVPVCKFLTVELQDALEKTGRSKEVLEVGEVLDTGKRRRKIKYNTS